MKIYKNRLIKYGIIIVVVFLFISAIVVNKPYADLRAQKSTVEANSTQTEIAFLTLNAPTNTPGPSPTVTPLPTITPLPTLTNTPVPPTFTPVPPCQQVVSHDLSLYSEPSLAMTEPDIKIEKDEVLSLLGRLEGEPWWRVSRIKTQTEGWILSSDISAKCPYSDKQIGYWLNQKDILYDTFRGLYPWIDGKTEFTTDNKMKFFYTTNTQNFAKYYQPINLDLNTEIRTSFTVDLDQIKLFGLRDQDSFVSIKLTDINDNKIDFRVYLDCSYSPNDDRIRPRLLQTCDKRENFFILLNIIDSEIKASVNGELLPPFPMPTGFENQNVSISLGAYPEAYFDYMFVTSNK